MLWVQGEQEELLMSSKGRMGQGRDQQRLCVLWISMVSHMERCRAVPWPLC